MKVLLSFTILTLVAHFAAAASEPDCSPGNPEHQPHPTDCNKYYTCSNGVAILQECPPGLWWSVEMETCDLPENTICDADVSSTTMKSTTTETGSSSVPTEPTGTTMPSTTTGTGTSSVPTEPTGTTSPSSTTAPTTTPPTSTSTQASTTPPAPVNRCPPVEDPEIIIRYPHETNCEFYYKCEQGHPTLYRCIPGDHFSPTKRVCRSKNVAGCDSCPEIEDISDVIRLPHESICHFYYLCKAGGAYIYQCAGDLDFSRMDRVCMPPEEAMCTLNKVWH